MQHATCNICQEKGEKIWRYKFFVVSLWSKNNDRIGMKILSNTHNLLIIRRLLPPPYFADTMLLRCLLRG